MRKELELIEKIERFLNDGLSLEERESFQKEIDITPALKKEVEKQILLQEGIQSMMLKKQAQNAFKKYRLFKFFKLFGIPTLIIIASIIIWSLYQNQRNSSKTGIPTESDSIQTEKIIEPINEISDTIKKPESKEQIESVPTIEKDTLLKKKPKPVVDVPDIIIEAEDYTDFNDISPENVGNAFSKDAVDIYDLNGIIAVGHTFPNEWLEYTFDIPEEGEYELFIKVGSGQDSVDRAIDLTINNNSWKTINPPFTGSWIDYKDVSCGTYKFNKGQQQKLKLDFKNGWINLDKITIHQSKK